MQTTKNKTHAQCTTIASQHRRRNHRIFTLNGDADDADGNANDDKDDDRHDNDHANEDACTTPTTTTTMTKTNDEEYDDDNDDKDEAQHQGGATAGTTSTQVADAAIKARTTRPPHVAPPVNAS